jgi:hypothetical protein
MDELFQAAAYGVAVDGQAGHDLGQFTNEGLGGEVVGDGQDGALAGTKLDPDAEAEVEGGQAGEGPGAEGLMGHERLLAAGREWPAARNPPREGAESRTCFLSSGVARKCGAPATHP